MTPGLRSLPALIAVAAALCAFAPATASAGFVQRSGTGLTLDGSPWRFAGHNNYQLTGDRAANGCGRTISLATLRAILQDAKSTGAQVVRTWFFQSYYRNAGNSWAPFDRVLNEAAAKGLKVVPVLVNHYPDCEPSGGARKDEGFYEYGFRQTGWGYPESSKSWARRVANRYAANQTVAFWQLVNEAETSWSGGCNRTPDPARWGNGYGRSANILRAFADEMTSHLKAGDPNHLVSLGTIGSGQCGSQEGEYQFVHSGAVDLCEYHDYGDVIHSLPDDGYNRLRQRVGQCDAIGKPLFVGETAVAADVGDQGESTGSITAATLQRRAGFFDAKLTAAFRNGIDGYLVWEKIPDASNSAYNLNNGRYGVGPSSLFADPTNDVSLRQSQAFGAIPGTVRSTWEDGTLGSWNVAWGSANLSLANTTYEAWGGFRSLQLNLTGSGSGVFPAARTYSTAGAGPGVKITYHLYRPAGAPSTIQAKPYVSNNAWQQSFGPDTNLTYGWSTFSWTVPTGLSTPLQAVGLQINNNSGWTGQVYLDDVSW